MHSARSTSNKIFNWRQITIFLRVPKKVKRSSQCSWSTWVSLSTSPLHSNGSLSFSLSSPLPLLMSDAFSPSPRGIKRDRLETYWDGQYSPRGQDSSWGSHIKIAFSFFAFNSTAYSYDNTNITNKKARLLHACFATLLLTTHVRTLFRWAVESTIGTVTYTQLSLL